MNETKKDSVAVLDEPTKEMPSQEQQTEPPSETIDKIVSSNGISKTNPAPSEQKKVTEPVFENSKPEEKNLSANAPVIADEKYKSIDANFSMGKAVMDNNIATTTESAEQLDQIAEKKSVADDDLKVKDEEVVRVENTFSGQAAPAAASTQLETIATSKKSVANNKTKNSLSTLDDAKIDFANGNYNSAKSKLEQLIKADPTNLEAIFYLAKTQRELKQFSKSTHALNTVLQNTNSNFYAEAQWLKALNLIDIGKTDVAKILLEQIVNANGEFANSASEKLKILK